ncbi:MAG: Prevent-host-death family protein [Candidatus Roizmanbacteria bacterium GW2011_GWA2_37_7]|uniref:Prevent-host-death family protein n=1 Tax=Candidatus Roizmanbacteria bacterium GW2011_GWA2_37_7 TaxID=1618481 RepID=A0A0G0H6E3_9BACT|nr:MAG: Prevent-host-death family protein [Candidatus Roizmanbacteria bacterium GW2011_GWA2_37_7]
MIQANIQEAKTNLSHLVEMALSGKKVIIAKYNKPLIELKPLEEKKGKRVLGQSKGKIILTDAFFEPLPDDILEAFNNPE